MLTGARILLLSKNNAYKPIYLPRSWVKYCSTSVIITAWISTSIPNQPPRSRKATRLAILQSLGESCLHTIDRWSCSKGTTFGLPASSSDFVLFQFTSTSSYQSCEHAKKIHRSLSILQCQRLPHKTSPAEEQEHISSTYTSQPHIFIPGDTLLPAFRSA